jgi:hypothetical protein
VAESVVELVEGVYCFATRCVGEIGEGLVVKVYSVGFGVMV